MSADVRLLFVREAETMYRLRHGQIRAMIKAKRLRGIKRGRRTLVSAKQCEEVLGVG